MASKKIDQLIGIKSLTAQPWGQETVFELTRNVQSHTLGLRLNADLSIADPGGGAAGTLRNRGSLMALVNLSIEDSGNRETIVEGRVAKLFAEMMAPRPLNDFLRLAAGGVQANTLLNEFVPLHFALPIAANPQETVFMERDPNKPLRLIVQTVLDGRGALCSAATMTWTWNSLNAELVQSHDPFTRVKPLFIPVLRKLASQIIPGAANDISIPVTSDKWLHSIVIQSTAGGYEVGDIIDRLSIRSDRRQYIDGKPSIGFLASREQRLFGGGVPTVGYYPFLFAENGRLANCLNPVEDSNLRVIVDVDAVSTTFVGTNVVTVWGLELQRVPGLTADEIGFSV